MSNNDVPPAEPLRDIFTAGIDYLASVIALMQARLTQYALSSALFIFLMIFAGLLFIAGFVMLNIAAGVALAHALGCFWSLLILGGAYFLLAGVMGGAALRWLKRLGS